MRRRLTCAGTYVRQDVRVLRPSTSVQVIGAASQVTTQSLLTVTGTQRTMRSSVKQAVLTGLWPEATGQQERNSSRIDSQPPVVDLGMRSVHRTAESQKDRAFLALDALRGSECERRLVAHQT